MLHDDSPTERAAPSSFQSTATHARLNAWASQPKPHEQQAPPLQAAADERQETRRVLTIQANADAETLMHNGIQIHEAFRRRFGSEAQE